MDVGTSAEASKHARWSMYLGVSSLMLSILTGIPAIILGARALKGLRPADRAPAYVGIGLGSFSVLVIVGLLALATASPAEQGAPTTASSPLPAAAVSVGWKPGETVSVGKCSYRLVKAYKRAADDTSRPHRLWEVVVALEASHADELDTWCSFSLEMRTPETKRVLAEDSASSKIAPGTKRCVSEGISKQVPTAMADVHVVLRLNPDSPQDQGFLKGLARESVRQRQVEVTTTLLPWDEYTQKVGFSIDCD